MKNWGNRKFNPHVKAQNFSEIAPNIAFPEFNFYELYYSTFEKSELGIGQNKEAAPSPRDGRGLRSGKEKHEAEAWAQVVLHA